MLPPVLVVIYNIRLYNFPSDVSLAIIVEFYLGIGRYEIEQSTWRQQHDNGYRFETDFQTPAGNDWVTERLGIDEVACCCGSKLRSSSSSRIFKRFISSFRTPWVRCQRWPPRAPSCNTRGPCRPGTWRGSRDVFFFFVDFFFQIKYFQYNQWSKS